MLSRQAPC